MTLVVNLFGGPGVSKSTNAALVFGQLKQFGINAEIAHEYAKDLVWEERQQALGFTPYVHAKQLYRIQRLIGKVDVVITDSPILMNIVYAQGKYGQNFVEFVIDMHHTMNTLNIFLQRNPNAHPYSEIGRNQTEEEARDLDREIFSLVSWEAGGHTIVPVREGMWTAQKICQLIYEKLQKDSP